MLPSGNAALAGGPGAVSAGWPVPDAVSSTTSPSPTSSSRSRSARRSRLARRASSRGRRERGRRARRATAVRDRRRQAERRRQHDEQLGQRARPRARPGVGQRVRRASRGRRAAPPPTACRGRRPRSASNGRDDVGSVRASVEILDRRTRRRDVDTRSPSSKRRATASRRSSARSASAIVSAVTSIGDAVVRAEQQQAVGARVGAREQVGERREVVERLRHLHALDDDPAVVRPSAGRSRARGRRPGRARSRGAGTRGPGRPPCRSKSSPSSASDITTHSVCHPGRPAPNGASQRGSPGLTAFHSAKSSGERFCSSTSTRAPARSESRRLAGEQPVVRRPSRCRGRRRRRSRRRAPARAGSRSSRPSRRCRPWRGASSSGGARSSASIAAHHCASYSAATSGSVRPSRAARAMILSSTSVTFETWSTSSPQNASHRRTTSQVSVKRPWPMCGGRRPSGRRRTSTTRPRAELERRRHGPAPCRTGAASV